MAKDSRARSAQRPGHTYSTSSSFSVFEQSALPTSAIFEALLHSAPDAMVIVDADAHIVLVNQQAAQMFGYTPAELLGQAIELLLPERVRALHERHRSGYIGSPHTRPMGAGMELVARRKDGSEFAVEVSLSPLETDDGLLITSIIRDVTERKRAAEVVARQASLLELARDAIIVRDMEGCVSYWNRGAETMYGWSAAEAIGQQWDVLLQTQFPQPVTEIEAAISEAGYWEGELTHIRRDGSLIEVASRWALQRDAEGQPIAILQINNDITERKKADQALRQLQERFAKVFRASPAAISITRLSDGLFLDVNASFLDLTGYERGEAVGHNAAGLQLWGDEHVRADVIAQLNQGRSIQGIELVIRAKSGMLRHVLTSAEVIDLDGQRCVLDMFQDITARKRAEAALEQQVQLRTAYLNTLLTFSKELFRARGLDEVLEQAVRHAMTLVPEAESGVLYLYDPHAEVLSLRVTVGFEQMPAMSVPLTSGLTGLAWTTRQIQSTNTAFDYQALVPSLSPAEREQLQRAIQQPEVPSGVVAVPLLTQAEPLGVMLLLRRRGEGVFATEVRPTLEGLATLIVAAILDARSREAAATLSTQLADLEQAQQVMTERLNTAEAQMLQAARLAAVGELAASIAHEINNPLYAARNSLYLLGKDLPTDTRSATYLTLARDQLARIAGIIERMRDFYRPDRGEMLDHDLNALLEATLALAGLNLKDGRIHVVFAPAFDLPEVRCNAEQLRQVFLNLVLNAIDAMTSGGTLTVRTKAEPTAALVEVQDTGTGIAADLQPHLFEPFWTNKANGTGLGLSISAHIVTQHGGRIEVESQPGQGSLFRVVLPYHTEA